MVSNEEKARIREAYRSHKPIRVPVIYGALRRELGPDVELLGGPEVGLLLTGTPEQVGARTRAILESGVMAGGRFILREANNLPPRVPEANLQAMYQACLEHGVYGS